MKTWIPGSTASALRSRWITAAAGGRWSRGARFTNIRPLLTVLFGPPAPTAEVTVTTARSTPTIAAACCCSATMAGNEMSWPASVVTESCPISSTGKNPLGISIASQTEPATVASIVTRVTRRWRSTHCSARS